jgi:hypothetical protein
MAITKRPSGAERTAGIDDFIARAPDAGHDQPHPAERRRKQVISPGVDSQLLKRFDALADRLGLTRAAAISLAMVRLLEQEEGG